MRGSVPLAGLPLILREQVPYAYGGSKYARNPPVPPEIHVVMDYNRDQH